jgi:methionyl-tRNA synthetase
MDKEKEYEFLKHFEINHKPFLDSISDKNQEFADEVIQLAKKKGLTYAGTYASLEYAYEYLKYESNFVSVR